MEKHTSGFALDQNLSADEEWARAAEAVEHIVGSEEPLVAVPDLKEAPLKRDKKRVFLARPLGLSLFFASGIAIAFALYPAAQNGIGTSRSWHSARE